MKQLLKYMLIAVLAVVFIACTKSEEVTPDEPTGRLKLQFSLPGKTRAAAYDALSFSTLRVYKMENGEAQLIRKYYPATTTPADIYLIEGDYKVTVDAGDKSEATFNRKSYYGEQAFTLVAQQPQIVMVECKITNIAVRVEYEQTVHDKLDKGFLAYVSTADAFSLTEAENNSVPTLKYADKRDTTGFFMLPKEVNNLSWGLYGEGSIVGKIEKTGVIAAPVAGKQYTLTFKYSKTPDGFLNVVVTTKEYEEKFDDNFIFSPQPTITGDGFTIDDVQGYFAQPIRYRLTSIDDISEVTVTTGGVTYPLLNTGAILDPGAVDNGLNYIAEDASNGIISIDAAFFAKLPGGIHDLTFNLRDRSNIEGKSTAKVAVQGIAALSNIDLWANSLTLNAIVTDPDVSSVTIKFRNDNGAWETIATTSTSPFLYSASILPSWEKQTNEAGKPVYFLKSGILPGKTVDYQLVLNDVEMGDVKSYTPSTDQTVPYGDMEDGGLSCFSSSNTNAPYWASGNNDMAKSLCTWSSFTGNSGAHCAKLAAKGGIVLVGLAAGNLFTGTFNQSGTSGTASFGLPYTWKARPTSLKLKYHATIGNVTNNTYDGPIAKGQPDKGRIFVVVIDWGSRHGVTSGVGGAKNVWDPVNGPTAVTAGEIIGYGSTFLTQSTAGDAMVDLELPICYYDTVTKPSKNYTLVISCATSAYGDYMNGCSSNVLYVDDFQWGY